MFIIQSHSGLNPSGFSPDSSSLDMSLTPRRVRAAANPRHLGRWPSTHPSGPASVLHWPPIPDGTPPTCSSALARTDTGQSIALSPHSPCGTGDPWGQWYPHSSLFHWLPLSVPCVQAPCPLLPDNFYTTLWFQGIFWCSSTLFQNWGVGAEGKGDLADNMAENTHSDP